MAGEARRANRAGFRLSIDGVDLTDRFEPRLVSLRLTDKRGGEADQLDIVLDDTDGRLDLPRKGVEVRLALGWLAGADVVVGLVDKGRFTVDQVEWGGPPDLITIRARSADLTADFRVRREASHRDTTLGAIAREIAKRQGLTAKVAVTLDGIAVPVLAQHQQSDIGLLRRLGRRHDAIATVKDRTLILAPIGAGATASGRALPDLRLTRADVATYRYSEIERSADAGVEARWHDQDAGERKTVKVGGAAGKAPRRLRRVYHNEAEAKDAAAAEAGKAVRSEHQVDVTMLGRADVAPERPTTLHGFKAPIDALTWIVAEVSHSLDRNGYTTRLLLERSQLLISRVET